MNACADAARARNSTKSFIYSIQISQFYLPPLDPLFPQFLLPPIEFVAPNHTPDNFLLQRTHSQTEHPPIKTQSRFKSIFYHARPRLQNPSRWTSCASSPPSSSSPYPPPSPSFPPAPAKPPLSTPPPRHPPRPRPSPSASAPPATWVEAVSVAV